jgi:hypothetical protein
MHFQLTADSSSSTPRIWWSTKAATIFLDGSGPTLGLWGGTLLQWLVPFLLAVYFFNERQTAGFVFCLFFFFENWLYTATYMADARAQVLPLVTTGDPEFVEHDFYRIFTDLGVLNYDTKIAAVVCLLGWCGMIGVVGWFALHGKDRQRLDSSQAGVGIGDKSEFFGKHRPAPNSKAGEGMRYLRRPHGRSGSAQWGRFFA